MLPFALWEGAGGRGREGRGRSGPRNVFGVREGATGAPKSPSEYPSRNRVLCWAFCLCLAKGMGETLTFTSFHPSPHPSISSFLPFNILPFFHSSSPSFYPSVFLFPSLISFTHSSLVLFTHLKVYPPSLSLSLAPSLSLSLSLPLSPSFSLPFLPSLPPHPSLIFISFLPPIW